MKLFYEFSVVAAALVGSSLLTASCEPDNCTIGDTRCHLNRVEICGSDRNWTVSVNCNEIGNETISWVCCWMPYDPVEGIPEGHGCLQGTTCPATGADVNSDANPASE